MLNEERIGIYIIGHDLWKPNKLIVCPVITAHLVDKGTGECVSKVSYTSNKDLTLPTLTSRLKVFSRRDPSPVENGPLLLDEKISSLNSNKILLFEICKTARSRNSVSEKKRIAWAFLVPIASDGTKNIGKELKLQLYTVRRNCKISHQTCNVYHLYKDHKLKKFLGVLGVKIEGIKGEPEEKVETPQEHPKEEIKKSSIDMLKDIRYPEILQWSRLPTQSCKIPNQLHTILSLGRRGSSCVRFSQTGNRLAIASGERIFIHEITSWAEESVLKGHDGFIYDMDWSEKDEYLLSVSNDCTCIVWNMTEKVQNFVLPHPSFVYCGKWITPGAKLVTGCKDHLIRCWTYTGEAFEMSAEVRGHSGFVSSIALQGTSTLISGDSNGCITIHRHHNQNWSLVKQLELSETSFGIIDSIHVCNSRTRVIVTSRSKGSFMVDLNAGIITQKYKSLGNVILRSIPCLTPCGSLFFAICQNGEVGVWNAHTGKHLASYESLFPVRGLSEICGSMHYNPFEHMIAIGALDYDYPVLILKYGQDESKKLGLVYYEAHKKHEASNIDSNLFKKKR